MTLNHETFIVQARNPRRGPLGFLQDSIKPMTMFVVGITVVVQPVPGGYFSVSLLTGISGTTAAGAGPLYVSQVFPYLYPDVTAEG